MRRRPAAAVGLRKAGDPHQVFHRDRYAHQRHRRALAQPAGGGFGRSVEGRRAGERDERVQLLVPQRGGKRGLRGRRRTFGCGAALARDPGSAARIGGGRRTAGGHVGRRGAEVAELGLGLQRVEHVEFGQVDAETLEPGRAAPGVRVATEPRDAVDGEPEALDEVVHGAGRRVSRAAGALRAGFAGYSLPSKWSNRSDQQACHPADAAADCQSVQARESRIAG